MLDAEDKVQIAHRRYFRAVERMAKARSREEYFYYKKQVEAAQRAIELAGERQ